MDSTQITPSHVSDEEANLLAMELVYTSAVPMVLTSAIQLDLLEIMAKAGPDAFLSPKQVASQLSTNNPDAPLMIDRVFRLLASYSVLAMSSDSTVLALSANSSPRTRMASLFPPYMS
ncbi:hypothetical protein V6N11_038968 [Hibiscus sabdariffa]|uniref:O-methyltransferase dimerisation domain-containing protein n=1 Tax=Hibiscus sabdariffa TaxID=183260 RepID=A0ABR2SME1_9ROSI